MIRLQTQCAAILSLIVVANISCSFRHGPVAVENEVLKSRKDALMAVRRGMTEADVIEQVGPGDEVRHQLQAKQEGEAHARAYGVSRAAGFAQVGLVLFDTNNRVLDVWCPTRLRFCRKAALSIPVTAAGTRSPNGLICRVEEIIDTGEPSNGRDEQHQELRDSLRFTLQNKGNRTYELRIRSQARFELVIEVFDSQKHLLLRHDLCHYSLENSPFREQWPVLRLAPGEKFWGEWPLWLTDGLFGVPAPGRYYARVLFPFETDRFCASNLKGFTIP
jgi:hypothetical protein